jgi:hypothetical protein
MVNRLIAVSIVVSVMLLPSTAIPGDGIPLKYISSCQIDLNGDNELDMAMLVETVRGRELLALIKTSQGYNSYVVSLDKPDMSLSCHYGKTVTETLAGKGNKPRKSYATPGAFISLNQPEGSSVAYFWNGKGFTEVWTAD